MWIFFVVLSEVMRPVYVIGFSPLLVSLDVLFDLLETVHFIEYLDLFLSMGVDEPVYRE